MNSYFTQLAEELHELWQGVVISIMTPSIQMSVKIKAALSCCACDALIAGWAAISALKNFHTIRHLMVGTSQTTQDSIERTGV